MKLFVFIIFGSLSYLANSAECPWMKMKGSELFGIDTDLSYSKNLSLHEIKEDLECLQIVMRSHYAPLVFERRIDFESNIKKQSWEEVQNSQQFAQKLFELHNDKIDLHLSYSLYKEQINYSFTQENLKTVILKPELATEKIIEKDHYIYFRPQSFVNQTKTQKRFLDLVRKIDKNIILDLRSNGGGVTLPP